jgi:hypothetical protein
MTTAKKITAKPKTGKGEEGQGRRSKRKKEGINAGKYLPNPPADSIRQIVLNDKKTFLKTCLPYTLNFSGFAVKKNPRVRFSITAGSVCAIDSKYDNYFSE